MNSTAAHARKRTVGRPRTSDLTRAEQLRRAKRVQREREGRAGQVEARVKLPQALARRLHSIQACQQMCKKCDLTVKRRFVGAAWLRRRCRLFATVAKSRCSPAPKEGCNVSRSGG